MASITGLGKIGLPRLSNLDTENLSEELRTRLQKLP